MIWKGKTANSGARVSNDETPGLTHAFQPADQFVISTLKALVHTGWNKYVEALFAQHDVEGAVGIMYSSCATVVKKQKYRLFAEALDVISRDVVYASWEMSGIMKYAFGAPNSFRGPRPTQRLPLAPVFSQFDPSRSSVVCFLGSSTHPSLSSHPMGHLKPHTLQIYSTFLPGHRNRANRRFSPKFARFCGAGPHFVYQIDKSIREV